MAGARGGERERETRALEHMQVVMRAEGNGEDDFLLCLSWRVEILQPGYT